MNSSLGMDIQSPEIDPRKHQQLIEQLNKMVPYYTPEWKFSETDPDFGSALALMFLHLLEGNISRLNQIPYKSLITFLNHFNVELAPATSAVAQIAFELVEGAPESVLVERGLQLSAASTESSEPIVFETIATALLTTAKLQHIIAVYPRKDRIVVHRQYDEESEQVIEAEQSSYMALYGSQGENIQEHAMYIAHDFLFLVNEPAYMELKFKHPQHESALLESLPALADADKTVWEYYSNGQWFAFNAVHCYEDTIRLIKLQKRTIDAIVIEQQERRWIRCRAHSLAEQDGGSILGKLQFETVVMKTDYAAAKPEIGIAVEQAYFNDMQINPYSGSEPFGDFFAPYNLFYIKQEESFSKRGAYITISFQLEYGVHRLIPQKPKPINWKPIMKREVLDAVDQPDIVTITQVQWEYWNGRSWVQLLTSDQTGAMFSIVWDGKQQCELSFICPSDIEMTEISGEQSYWIRARIVSVNNAYSIDAVYYSPYISELQTVYRYEEPKLAPQHFITYNNLQMMNRTAEVLSGGLPFRPFQPLIGYQPTVWFGFDEAPKRGPIHLYIDLLARNWRADEIPHVQWEYLRAVGGSEIWSTLAVADDTQGFTQSGSIQFVGPQDFAYRQHFGRQGYWIRAVNRDTKHYANNEAVYEPKVKQFALNTLTVVQQQTISNELPTFVDGYHLAQNVHDSYYALSVAPVLSEQIWVDETNIISSYELDRMKLHSPELLDIMVDSEGHIMKIWVQYERVDQFLRTKPDDRHYVIDRANGRIWFGNGKQGRGQHISGVDQVKAHYISGGGKKGNVGKGQITTIQNAIAYIDSITNERAASGGCDAGTVKEAVTIGSKRFAHRGRAVVANDFEWITKEIHPNVSKVRCLPNVNVKLAQELGALTIVVMPKSGTEHGTHFQELKRTIEQSLLQRAAASIAFPNKLQVIEPAYVEIGVRATIWVRNMDEVVQAERELQRKLKQFLHPLTGNTDGKGWSIGGSIHPSMFYALMKSVGPVVHIPQLLLEAYKVEHGERVEWNPEHIADLPHSIVMPGQHLLAIEVHK